MLNSKKMIGIMISLVIIIILLITGLLIYTNRGKIFYGVDEEPITDMYIPDEKVRYVTNRNDYYVVQTCINKFYIYYAAMYSIEGENGNYAIDEAAMKSIEETKKANATSVYNMLDEEYISLKQITEENIAQKMKEISTQVIDITDMYVSEKSQNNSIYIAQGALREKQTGNISDFKMIIKLDTLKRTFSVLPQDYVEEKYPNIAIRTNYEYGIFR